MAYSTTTIPASWCMAEYRIGSSRIVSATILPPASGCCTVETPKCRHRGSVRLKLPASLGIAAQPAESKCLPTHTTRGAILSAQRSPAVAAYLVWLFQPASFKGRISPQRTPTPKVTRQHSLRPQPSHHRPRAHPRPHHSHRLDHPARRPWSSCPWWPIKRRHSRP